MKLPTRGLNVALVRALALGDLALAFVGARALWREHQAHGFAEAIAEGGAATTFVSVTGLLVAPLLTAAWLGFGLWRLDRVAWVGQVAAGITVPIVCAIFAAVGLAEGAMAPILGGVGAFFAVSLLLLVRRAARWSFGIGPDAVLAEVHTRGDVSVAELARRFSVGPEVVETLLAQLTARGAFLGGWDRASGRVYSVATLVSREALRRCPRCGGAVESVAHVARCPYCGTEFAELRGLEHPVPSPIGVDLLAALDRVLAYVATFLALVWVATFLEGRVRPAGEDAKLWWIFGGGPVALALVLVAIGRRLQAGRRSGWIAQQVALPFALPYLLRRRVRALFASGLGPAREQLAREGELSFEGLARTLKIAPRHAEEIAVHLTATRALDSVIDWQTERLVSRAMLSTDGRERCQSCGAPLRLGGLCAFCGTSKARAAEPPPPAKLPSAGWGLASFVTRGAAIVIPLVALAVRPTSASPTGAPSPRPLVSLSPLDLALVPVGGDYDPRHQEIGWVSGGVTALAFDARDRLFSGDQNGLFVWEEGRRAWRTPSGDARFAGGRWIDFDPDAERASSASAGSAADLLAESAGSAADVSSASAGSAADFLLRSSYPAIVRGRTRDLRVESRLDFTRLLRELQAREGLPHLPEVLATTRDAQGRLLGLVAARGLHLYDLSTGESLLVIPEETIAQDGPFVLSDATIDRSGGFVALFARDTEPGPGGLLGTRRQKMQVWDVGGRIRRLQWMPEISSTDAVLLMTAQQRLRFAPNPRFLVSLTGSELRYWDVALTRAMRVTGGRFAGPIAFSDDGRFLAVAHHPSPSERSVEVRVFQIGEESLKPLEAVVTHPTEVSALAFDPTGELLASGDVAGNVRFTTLRMP